MVVYVKLMLTAVFWGGTFIAGRVIARDIGPFSAAFFRFLIASAVLFMVTVRLEGRVPGLKGAQVIPVFLLGLTGVFAYNVFFFKGLKLIAAGRAAIIIASNPIFIAMLSAYFFKEKLTPVKLFGILISVAGAVIVIARGDPGLLFSHGIGWGEVYIFGCVASWVAYSLIGKAVLAGLPPLTAVFYASAVGTFFLFFPAYWEGAFAACVNYPAVDWFGMFYLGFFGTVIGFVWYYEGIKTIGPTKASLFINFVPISAVLLAFLMLEEPITMSLLVGTVLVSCGVYLTNAQFGAK